MKDLIEPEKRWLIMTYGYFLSTMQNDCFNYARGRAMDFVGKIAPSSSNEYTFIIVVIDYFTKWVEAKELKSISSAAVITFIKQQIVHRFGIPKKITKNRGTSFIPKEIQNFTEEYNIKFVQSSPYFPRANGEVESTNKVLINIIKRRQS
ncbi:unnamed protein product [Prunus armeniaca]